MMKKIDTAAADRIIVGRLEPHIYAFSTRDAPNALKVGDTYRSVFTRLKEWKKIYSDLNLEFEHSAKLDDDRIFRDFSVHQYLVKNNRVRLEPDEINNNFKSREFFKDASPDDLDRAIKAIKESALNNDGTYKFYSNDLLPETFTYERNSVEYLPRPNQERTVENFGEAIRKGHTNLLMYAVMRFGKSFTAMCCAIHEELNSKIVVILSAKADVQDEWKKTVETHRKFTEFDFLNKDDLEENNSIITEKIAAGRRVVVFLTFQDLHGEDLKKRHEELFSEQLDLLIIDETHFGARAEEYGKVLRHVGLNSKQAAKERHYIDENHSVNSQALKAFNARISLHLSGTPYRILMGDEFSEEQIIACYQFVDIVEDQKQYDRENHSNEDYKEWENPYYGFPEMVRFAFHPNKSSRERMNQLRNSGATYAFSELFRPKSIIKTRSNEHRQFKYEKEILELFQAIDGKEPDKNLLSFLDYDKIQDGNLCRHIVCVLPFRASCDALESLIHDNSNKFIHLKNFKIINISGVENERLYPNVQSVKSVIAKCEQEDRKTITLTVNRMLTGSTVKEWDTMLYFKDTASPQEYDQAIFRLQNQYVKTYKDGSEVVKLNMKPQTLLVDFDPNRLFHLQVQKSLFYNVNNEDRGNDELEKRINKELEISPVVSININGDKLVKITPTNIIDAVRNYSQNKSILEEANDVPFDKELFENYELRTLIESIRPIDSKKGLKIEPAEGEGLDIDTSEPAIDGYSKEKEPISTKFKHEEDDLKIIEKKLAAYRLRILFYSFLTDSVVDSMTKLIESIDSNESNKRILKNVGLYKNDLVRMKQASSQFILNQFEYKIKNINDLGRDKELTPVDRASRAMRKFARVSDSEIVMPAKVANDLIGFIPESNLDDNSIILDLSSKQGELAMAIYKRFGKLYPKLMNNVYSVTTSSLAYELTKKVYKSLNLPLDRILEFNSFDLLGENKRTFIERLTKIKPSVVLAGPPYQTAGGSAIYHKFFNIAQSLSPRFIAMIIKASWYSGGKGEGLVEFRKAMLNDKRISILHDYPDPTIYFDSPATLRGGVCTFLWDSTHNADCEVFNHINNRETKQIRPLRTFSKEDILIRYNIGVTILHKVLKTEQERMSEMSYTRNFFKIASNEKSILDKKKNSSYLKVYLPKKKIGFISKLKVACYEDKKEIDQWKVLVAKASPGDDTLPHLIISEPIISEPGSICTDSHLLVRVVNSRKEAENLVSYMKTKFFRFLMLLAKNNHNMSKNVFRYVPVQDFNKVWTDAELYAKYQILKEDIHFIDSVIKMRD